jgi:hypothetical protein
VFRTREEEGEFHTVFGRLEDDRQTFLDCRRTAAIQERASAVLRSIPKEAFADSFQKLYERCQPSVVKDDDYFECQ